MKRVAVTYEYYCRIILMIFVVHVAFIFHTILGLIFVGFFPSIAATYATYRAWIINVGDRSWSIRQTWTSFHQSWKGELKSANLFGYPQFALWFLLIWEYWVVQHNDMGVAGVGISGALLLLNAIYGLFVATSWCVHANFNESLPWILRFSVTMIIARPLCSIMSLLLLVIIVWAYVTWPGLIMAFGIALPVFAVMMAIYSWGRLPGMDIHVLEPREKASHKN